MRGESRDDESFGQVDGDASGGFVEYRASQAGTPWLRAPMSPWHMWGNTQQQSVLPLGGASVPLVATTSQLCRVNYGRPETWHWVFSAKLVSGPDTTEVGQHGSLSVRWDLIIGVGRSAIVLPDFDRFDFDWNDGAPFPRDAQIWSTETLSPGKHFTRPPPTPAGITSVSQFSAQDIQLSVRCFAQELSIDPVVPIVVELSAHFSPKTHVRPDWMRDGPPEVQFPGAEIEGR